MSVAPRHPEHPIVGAGLDDRTRTLDELDQANTADSQWQGWLGQDHIFDPIRTDPRFIALMKKLHFKELKPRHPRIASA